MHHTDVGIVSFTGSTGVGPQGLRGLRARLQALPPGDGRQERHHGDGRRQARPGGRRRRLGRLRHHRPALHGGQPGGGPQEGLQGVRASASCERAQALRVGNGLDDDRARWARASTRASSRRSRATWGSASDEGAKLLRRRQPPGPGEHARGYFHEPTIFGDCVAEDAGRAGGDLRPGGRRDPGRLAGAGDRGRATRVEYGLSASIYTQDINKAFTAMRDMYTGHLLRERAHHRRRDAPALRRHQEHRQRPPRGLRAGAGRLLGVEVASTSTTAARCSGPRSTRRMRWQGPTVDSPTVAT